MTKEKFINIGATELTARTRTVPKSAKAEIINDDGRDHAGPVDRAKYSRHTAVVKDTTA